MTANNGIYTVFNMAAWCYVKIYKKYKTAAHMMTVAIGNSLQTETKNRCAFSHDFVVYVISSQKKQSPCLQERPYLAIGSRVTKQKGKLKL